MPGSPYKTHTSFPEPQAGASRRGAAKEATARWLETIYDKYHRPQFRGLDPIDVLEGYRDSADREIVALLAAALAYGNVKAILRGVREALSRLGRQPHRQLLHDSPGDISGRFCDFRYRVTSDSQMAGLLIAVRHVLQEHGSLNACFLRHLAPGDRDVVPALGGFVQELCFASGRDLYHLLPHPQRGSACKRLMLYLRWMVRRDAIDPGGWTGIHPSQLIVPLDTHMHAMALRLGLTLRRHASLRTAIEVTEGLRRFAPQDPLRYDFALTRPGILRIVERSWPAADGGSLPVRSSDRVSPRRV